MGLMTKDLGLTSETWEALVSFLHPLIYNNEILTFISIIFSIHIHYILKYLSNP